MKKLFVLLLVLPCTLYAQEQAAPSDNVEAISIPKNEISITGGVFLHSEEGFSLSYGDFGEFAALSYYRNINKYQVGLVIEIGTGPYQWSYRSPLIALNRRFDFKKGYFYAGVISGYYKGIQTPVRYHNDDTQEGYSFGLQAGYILPIGKHFAFMSQLGIRSTQYWFNNYYLDSSEEDLKLIQYRDSYFFAAIPVSVGFRYRF